jgi:2-methylisocitrate lyase-like PEP mutase family enzyme
MAGKQVIPTAEMAQKLRAAVDARRDPDLLIIARTDARAVNGLEDALERGARYREAGADMLFIEAPESEAEVEAIAARFPDVPLLYNWAESGRTPPLPLARIRRWATSS